MSSKHVVMYSGGIGSWSAAERVAERHGTDGLILLFADTKIEDPDLYRFLREGAEAIGGEFVQIEDGRDPWQVFFDVKFIGNTRVDPCSRILKRELLRKWMLENCDPEQTTIYLGIDWSERHRIDRATFRYKPFNVEAPMCDPPYLSKDEMLEKLSSYGIEPPALYGQGFHHNNCGGFCVKSGQAQFAQLLKVHPDRYAHHEAQEERFREETGKDVAIMRDRRGGKSRPLTMREFRERLEAAEDEERRQQLFDTDEWGGCGCAI